MGDSPRPANWILERSLDGVNYKPWVFFAESEYDCKRLYEPLSNGPLTVTSGPRPWKLEDDEVSKPYGIKKIGFIFIRPRTARYYSLQLTPDSIAK